MITAVSVHGRGQPSSRAQAAEDRAPGAARRPERAPWAEPVTPRRPAVRRHRSRPARSRPSAAPRARVPVPRSPISLGGPIRADAMLLMSLRRARGANVARRLIVPRVPFMNASSIPLPCIQERARACGSGAGRGWPGHRHGGFDADADPAAAEDLFGEQLATGQRDHAEAGEAPFYLDGVTISDRWQRGRARPGPLRLPLAYEQVPARGHHPVELDWPAVPLRTLGSLMGPAVVLPDPGINRCLSVRPESAVEVAVGDGSGHAVAAGWRAEDEANRAGDRIEPEQ